MLIHDFKIVEEINFEFKLQIHYEFRIGEENEIYKSHYDVLGKNLIVFSDWYKESNGFGYANEFNYEQIQELKHYIVRDKKHRLRHLMEPYRFNIQ